MLYVKKLSGELLPYDESSLKGSLQKSGANEEQIETVMKEIDKILYDGIPTGMLYEKAFELLRSLKHSYAARYSLKKALRDLGPEGYYFEKWVTKLFQAQGFHAVSGQNLQGEAVKHEIDVVASKDERLVLCECKFRNDVDAKISVTTPMYFLSRFNDLKNLKFEYFGKELNPTEGYMVTNAYMTTDSIAFAEKYGIQLISWDYPEKLNIKQLVDVYKFYPVTCLTNLTIEERNILLEKNCILIKDIVSNPVLMDHFKFDSERKKIIFEEANDLVIDY